MNFRQISFQLRSVRKSAVKNVRERICIDNWKHRKLFWRYQIPSDSIGNAYSHQTRPDHSIDPSLFQDFRKLRLLTSTLVIVWVSTWLTPSIALMASKKSDSGSNPFSSQGPKSSRGTVIINLKSKQLPQTKRFTVISSLASLMLGRYLSTALAIASRLSESDLSPVYLQRHSRHTRLKDMEPFAKGTSKSAVEGLLTALEGAKAAAEAKTEARMESFIIVQGVGLIMITLFAVWILDLFWVGFSLTRMCLSVTNA